MSMSMDKIRFYASLDYPSLPDEYDPRWNADSTIIDLCKNIVELSNETEGLSIMSSEWHRAFLAEEKKNEKLRSLLQEVQSAVTYYISDSDAVNLDIRITQVLEDNKK